MTKRRMPDTFEDAAMEAAAGLGVDECARLVDRSPNAIRAWTDPDRDGRPTLHQAVVIDAACAGRLKGGRTPFLAAYLRQLRAMTGSALAVGDVVTEALDVPAAVGELIAVIRRVRSAQSDGGGALTPAEHIEIRSAIRNVRRELDELDAAVDADMARGAGR